MELIHGQYYWVEKLNYFGNTYQGVALYQNDKYGERFEMTGTEESVRVDYFDRIHPNPIQNPFN